jgi:hypothetical protein
MKSCFPHKNKYLQSFAVKCHGLLGDGLAFVLETDASLSSTSKIFTTPPQASCHLPGWSACVDFLEGVFQLMAGASITKFCTEL